MNEKMKQHIVTALLDVKKDVETNILMNRNSVYASEEYGICAAFITAACMSTKPIINGIMAWPKFSGDVQYPVPGGADAYYKAVCEESMWIGEYGKLRMELLDFLISYYSKEV